MMGERRVVAGTGLGSSGLPDANSYQSVPGCLISDPARCMVNPGKERVVLWSGVLPRVILFALAAGAAFGAVIAGHDVTIDGSLSTYVYQLANTEPSRAIVNFQLTSSGSHTQILVPNSDWLTATFAAGSGTGIQWIAMRSGIQPGGALSGFRVISSDAAGPATFRVDFDDFTSLPLPGFHVLHAWAEWSAGGGWRDSGGTGLARPAGGSTPFASSWGSMRGWAAPSKS